MALVPLVSGQDCQGVGPRISSTPEHISEDPYGASPDFQQRLLVEGALCEGAGSNAPIPRGQTGWQTLALLANHILSGSYQVLGDGFLEMHNLQLYMKHGSQNCI